MDLGSCVFAKCFCLNLIFSRDLKQGWHTACENTANELWRDVFYNDFRAREQGQFSFSKGGGGGSESVFWPSWEFSRANSSVYAELSSATPPVVPVPYSSMPGLRSIEGLLRGERLLGKLLGLRSRMWLWHVFGRADGSKVTEHCCDTFWMPDSG